MICACGRHSVPAGWRYCWPCQADNIKIDVRLDAEHVALVYDLLAGVANDDTTGMVAGTVGNLLICYLQGKQFDNNQRVMLAASFIESAIDVVLLRKVLIMVVAVEDCYVRKIYL